MDAPGLPPTEVEDAYRVLRTVNRQFFGSARSLRIELDRWLGDERRSLDGMRIRILDVGSGSGDLPKLASELLALQGLSASPTALDRDSTALGLARHDGVIAVRADALALPFPDQSYDLVIAAKFAHHFSGSALSRLVAEMARVARRRVLILDIQRHWFAYLGFIAWSRVFTKNRLVRYDGPLSVLRGFTRNELLALTISLSEYRWTVRRYAGWQLVLIGQRGKESHEHTCKVSGDNGVIAPSTDSD
jgi:ubiquinone/menaquinone biosynthesis C-methylase UbiE